MTSVDPGTFTKGQFRWRLSDEPSCWNETLPLWVRAKTCVCVSVNCLCFSHMVCVYSEALHQRRSIEIVKDNRRTVQNGGKNPSEHMRDHLLHLLVVQQEGRSLKRRAKSSTLFITAM